MGAITPAVMNQSEALASQIKAKMLTDYMNTAIGGALNDTPSGASPSFGADSPVGDSQSSTDYRPVQPMPYSNISLLGKPLHYGSSQQGSGGMLDMFNGVSPLQADPGFMPGAQAKNPLAGLLSMYQNITPL